MLRSLILFAGAVVLVCPAPAAAHLEAGPPPLIAPTPAPKNLRGFLLRANEPLAHVFPRTPSFTWSTIKQPGVYQFELSMSRTFDESQILFSDDALAQPATAVPLQLPWMTGQPYALWAHVRFKGRDGKTTAWSEPFGFNMRWSAADVPKQIESPYGLVRWSPVDGATAYEVLYPDEAPARSFYTTTNVADEREYWTYHEQLGIGSIRWRVRAIRYIDQDKPLPNGLPQVTFGPWSPTFTTVNPPAALTTGLLTPAATVSDVYDRAGDKVRAHELTPGFSWTGAEAVPGIGVGSSLNRVYVSTDDHCVNTVFVGAVVGGPAYAPRVYGGPLTLAQSTGDLGTWQSGRFKLGGPEGKVFNATGEPVYTNEDPGKPVGSTAKAVPPSKLNGKDVARTDLWDSGWPNGRYYWTVVAVSTVYTALEPKTGTDSVPIEYHETQVPQDACEGGRLMSFGKVSEPVVAAASTPFVSGVNPTGRMVAAARATPKFHATPLVAWKPATGAQTYEVQWGQKRYPWVAAGTLTTPATSTVLPIAKKGLWYYRVRGVNPSLPPGAQNMSWSDPIQLQISGNVFKIRR